jgi:hypothetical protein
MLFTAVTCSSPALTVGVNPRSGLLPERAWEISREQTRTSLKLPKDPNEFVAILGTELDAAPLTHLREHSQVEIAPFDAAVCSGKSGVLVADQRIYGSTLAFRVRPEMR